MAGFGRTSFSAGVVSNGGFFSPCRRPDRLFSLSDHGLTIELLVLERPEECFLVFYPDRQGEHEECRQ